VGITFKRYGYEYNKDDNTTEVDMLLPVNILEYINSITSTLKPPVSNRLLHDEDTKMMPVGGPNDWTSMLRWTKSSSIN
jgi:hypothetical protein